MSQSEFNTQAPSPNSRAHAYRTGQQTTTPATRTGDAEMPREPSKKAARFGPCLAVVLLIPVALLLVGAVGTGFVHLSHLQAQQMPAPEQSSMFQGVGLLGKTLALGVLEAGLRALFSL